VFFPLTDWESQEKKPLNDIGDDVEFAGVFGAELDCSTFLEISADCVRFSLDVRGRFIFDESFDCLNPCNDPDPDPALVAALRLENGVSDDDEEVVNGEDEVDFVPVDTLFPESLTFFSVVVAAVVDVDAAVERCWEKNKGGKDPSRLRRIVVCSSSFSSSLCELVSFFLRCFGILSGDGGTGYAAALFIRVDLDSNPILLILHT